MLLTSACYTHPLPLKRNWDLWVDLHLFPRFVNTYPFGHPDLDDCFLPIYREFWWSLFYRPLTRVTSATVQPLSPSETHPPVSSARRGGLALPGLPQRDNSRTSAGHGYGKESDPRHRVG
jgi:hypothetical protein